MESSGKWCLCLAVLVVVISDTWAQTEGWLWTPPEGDAASGLQLPQDSPLSDSTPSRRPQRSRWPQRPQWPQRMAPPQPPRRSQQPLQPKVPLETQGPQYPQTQGHQWPEPQDPQHIQWLKPKDSQESDYSLESEVYQVPQRPKFPQQPQAQQPQQSQPQWPQRTPELQQARQELPLWPQQQLPQHPQQPQQPQQPQRPQQPLPLQPQQPQQPLQPQQPQRPQQQWPQQPQLPQWPQQPQQPQRPQQQLPQKPQQPLRPQLQLPLQPQQPQRPQQQLPQQPQQPLRPQQQLPLQPQQLPQQPQKPQQPLWPQQQLPLRPHHHPQQTQRPQQQLWPQQPQQPQLPPWPQQPQQPQRPQQFQQQLTQGPQLPERPMWNQNSPYPHELEWDDPSTNMLQDSPANSKCAVDENTKVTCGPPNITVEKCQTIDCCHDGRKCFYGKAVTVQCTKDGQFVLVIARDSIMPTLDLNSLSLLGGKDAPCSPVAANSAFAIFQFPVTECGTTMTEDDGFVIYENNMLSMYNVAIGSRGAITRDSHFELLFQCRYSGSFVEAVVVEVLPVPPPASITALGTLRVQLRLANGHCLTKGCSMEKEAFTSFYSEADYPVTKVLREPVYVEVNIQDHNDPSLVLMLDHCWVTASPSDVSLPQWDLLYNGCPYQDDRYLTTLVPVAASPDLKYPSHHKRFILQMFTFVDQNSLVPLKDTMFLHCSVSVCHSTVPGSCVQSCNRKRRAVPANQKTGSRMTLVSSREIILQ